MTAQNPPKVLPKARDSARAWGTSQWTRPTMAVSPSNLRSRGEDRHGHTVMIKCGECRALGASDRGGSPAEMGSLVQRIQEGIASDLRS